MAKKYYYDRRYLSFMRAQQTETANRDPFPKNRETGHVSHRSSHEHIDLEEMESEASSADEEIVEPTSPRGLVSNESIGSDAEDELTLDESTSVKENKIGTANEKSEVPSGLPNVSLNATETLDLELERPAPVRESSPETDPSSGPSPPSSATERLATEVAIAGIEEMRAQMTTSSLKLPASQSVMQDISANVTETFEPDHDKPASVRESSPETDASSRPSPPSSETARFAREIAIAGIEQDRLDRPAFVENQADASTGEERTQKSIEEEQVQQPREPKPKFTFRKTTN